MKIIYIVMTASPTDLRKKDARENYQPCTMENGTLFMAGNRANGCDVPTGFHKRQDAQNAIRRTLRFIKRKNLMPFWGNVYKITPVKIGHNPKV